MKGPPYGGLGSLELIGQGHLVLRLNYFH